MALSLGATVSVNIDTALKNTLPDATEVSDPFRSNVKKTYTDGTGSGKAQLCFHTKRTLLTTPNETLDLRALTGDLGAAFGTYTFSKVKAILISIDTATTGYRLEVGAAAGNQFIGPIKTATDIVVVPASGRWLQESPVDGWVVNAGCKDLLISNPSGGSVTYRIVVIGEGTAA